MSSNINDFSPDTHVKKSYLGRILATILFMGVGLFLAYSVFEQYQKLLIPSLILLASGIIVLTIWVDGLYIYRYLMPAILIIMVFTIYPIGYTVYIAFTNYGTGHLMVKEDAKKELLNSKWIIDYNESPLYAEFYISEEYVEKFNKEWNSQKKKYIEEINKEINKYIKNKDKAGTPVDPDNIYEDDIKEVLAIKDKWYDEIQPGIIDNMFSKVKMDNFTILAYDNYDAKITIDEDGKVIVNKDEQLPNVYLGKYIFNKKTNEDMFELNPIDFSEIENIVSGKYLVSDKVLEVINNDAVEAITEKDEDEVYSLSFDADEFYAESYSLNIRDFTELLEKLRDNTPLALYSDALSDYKRFLNSTGNEFMRKMKGFIEKDGEIYILVDEGDEKFSYSKKVYEDNFHGNFVLTLDNKEPVSRTEYAIKKADFSYGMFSISTNSEVETYLQSVLTKEGITKKIEIFNSELVTGMPTEEVDSAELKNVRAQIVEANKVIKKFNKNISKYKKEFTEAKRIELQRIDDDSYQKINRLKNEAIELEIKLKELKKEPKSYKVHLEMREIKSRQDVITSNVHQMSKEINGRKTQLKKILFPKVSNIALELKRVTNIDYNQNIEPGYMATIGFRNFTKIFTTRNITAPFLRVFVWTILWSLFSVISAFAVGLSLALVFNAGDLKGRFIYRTLFILPYAIPGFVSILMWSGFLNDEFGVINLALGLDIPWLQDPSGILPKISILLVNLWLSFPYMMIISLGALQSIDDSMYEAAEVDGASKFQTFSRITLPLLLIALGPMLVGSFAFAFNNFPGIYLLTGGGPVMASGVLPGHTDILLSYTYKLAFGPNQTDYGLASAIGIIVFFIIGSITFFNFKFTGTFKEVDNAA